MIFLLKNFVQSILCEVQAVPDIEQKTIQAPRILYHGTTADFKEFDKSKIGKRDSGNLGSGIYLTPSRRTAMLYAEDNVKKFGGEPVVLKVEHNLKKVADFSKFIDFFRGKLGISFPPSTHDKKRSDKIKNWFLSNNYDAASLIGIEIAVFDPAKLKIIGRSDAPSSSEYYKKVLADYLSKKEKLNEGKQKVYFHGSEENISSFSRPTKWIAFDQKTTDRPLWLSSDKKFAELYAGHNGWVYTVVPNVTKTFPDKELYKKDGNYYSLTPFGEKLLEDIVKSGMFEVGEDEWHEAEEILKSINNLDYGTLETKDFIDWLKQNGYDSFEVRGDGPTNLAVIDPTKIKIHKKEKMSSLDKFIESLLK